MPTGQKGNIGNKLKRRETKKDDRLFKQTIGEKRAM